MRNSNNFIFILFLYLLFSSCLVIKEKENSNIKDIRKNNIIKQEIENKKEEISKEKEIQIKIEKKLMSMSLIEKRGILTMVNIPGYELTDETINFLNNNKIKGVILFKYNIRNEEQLKKLIKDLREKIDKYLLIAIDQEGGNIIRIEWEETAKISPKLISFNTNPEQFAYDIAYKRGNYLKSLGINVVLAPVADIPSSNKDFIYERCFGIDTEKVSKLVEASVKGYRDSGIICVLKHFPGHGKTRVDSHYNFPVINKTIDELKKDDLVPFIAGIKAGAEMIMIGHIINSFIDKEKPASLSYNYVNLLNSLNFNGVIITDDLAMTGKIDKGIGWGINIITGSFKEIKNKINTIEPIDYYVKRVIKIIYFRNENNDENTTY
ncbi:MAG TPA: glycoside hydrolase family 3 N-terminal domain-containing protein [Spirochaetota bacterium]|nr:glycoside hydrolase family 3 N-terminal domain-containing protein [Spirochaetota bacterium]HOM39272.1 glycoside hydrolase family 3 N-terminal domain-containing protein [Spirochaetota bacterium]HPP05263.1 glycoside hydrolase family 3 N-terminal domain-containing protein [Spirochaetota bacterium]